MNKKLLLILCFFPCVLLAATNYVDSIVVSGSLVSDGSNLTNLNASQLTSGTVSSNQLPLASKTAFGIVAFDGTNITNAASGQLTTGTNVSTLNGTQTFSGVTGFTNTAGTNGFVPESGTNAWVYFVNGKTNSNMGSNGDLTIAGNVNGGNNIFGAGTILKLGTPGGVNAPLQIDYDGLANVEIRNLSTDGIHFDTWSGALYHKMNFVGGVLAVPSLTATNAPTLQATNAIPASCSFVGGVLTLGTNRVSFITVTNNGVAGSVLWIVN